MMAATPLQQLKEAVDDVWFKNLNYTKPDIVIAEDVDGNIHLVVEGNSIKPNIYGSVANKKTTITTLITVIEKKGNKSKVFLNKVNTKRCEEQYVDGVVIYKCYPPLYVTSCKKIINKSCDPVEIFANEKLVPHLRQYLAQM